MLSGTPVLTFFEPFLRQSQHPKQQDPITEPLKNFRSGVPDNIVPKNLVKQEILKT
jgi:hypothetical protein